MTTRTFLVLVALLAAIAGLVAAAQQADLVTIVACLSVGIISATLATVVPG